MECAGCVQCYRSVQSVLEARAADKQPSSKLYNDLLITLIEARSHKSPRCIQKIIIKLARRKKSPQLALKKKLDRLVEPERAVVYSVVRLTSIRTVGSRVYCRPGII